MVKKLVLYSLAGNVLKQNLISVGNVFLDTRINVAYPLKSGYGKTIIKNYVRKVAEKLNRTYSEPTSLHPEQLVGKVLYLTNDGGDVVRTVKNRGHLGDDYVLFDEAVELIRDRGYQQARDYINVALDTIGQNEIYKRSVNNLTEDGLKYVPTCTIMMFFHPVLLGESVLHRGFLRRFFIGYIHPSIEERERALVKSLTETYKKELEEELVDRLGAISSNTYKWEFKDIKSLIGYTKKLIEDGMTFSEKLKQATDVMYFTLRDRMMKLSCVLAGWNKEEKINSNIVRKAYLDNKEFWLSQGAYIEEKVLVKDYTKPKQYIFDTIIRNLARKGAVAEDKAININKFLEELSGELQTSRGMARFYCIQLYKTGTIGISNKKIYLKKVLEKEEKVVEDLFG